MMARVGLVAAALLLVAVAAYVVTRMIDADAPLATSSPGRFLNGCPAARLDGLLVADARSGTAVEVGIERKPIIWPFGYSGHRTSSGVVEVRDLIGVVVARTGEDVALGGGEITNDGRWSTCGPPLDRS
jgi:hypothetical protein